MAEPSKHLGSRISRITRGTVNAAAIRGQRRFLSETRNPYNAPAEAYTGVETTTPPPAPYTRAREEWELKIGELRARGLSYLDISVEMDTSEAVVGDVCRARGFVKGPRS